jgi:hypothetical protein
MGALDPNKDYSAIKEQYLAALIEIDPKLKINKTGWAQDHGVARQTIVGWEQEPEFRAAIDERLRKMNVDPLRIQRVLNAMFKQAEAGNVKAAELILRYADRLSPPKLIPEDTSIQQMSTDDLIAAIDKKHQHLKSVS